MITLEYFKPGADGTLQSDANGGDITSTSDGMTVTVDIDIPSKAPKAGYYPQQYSVSYSKATRKIRVTLLDMTRLEASSGISS